jgi:hypothetical protein
MRTQIALAILLAVCSTPASAQQPDPRWSPWLGCWQMLDERVRDANPSGADAVALARQRGLGSSANITVCVAPTAQPAGVTLNTRASGEPALEQTIVADGAEHPVNEAGCTGSQQAEWSADGRRLFARAELRCANQPVRTISGLTMITPGGTWLDVQAIDVAGRTNVRVREYRRTTFRAGTLDAAARSLTVAAVKEASAKVAAPALEAALIESGARFNLNRTALVDLDDANVPDSVIDLMVALSYPDKFQVERRIEQSVDLFTTPYSYSYADADWSGYYGFGYPYFSWYPGYYGNYRYFYSPFGYPYAGLYAPYGYYYGSSVVGGGAVTPPAPDTGEGRAISGVGYTRIRPREAVPVESGGSGEGSSRSGGRSTVSSGGYSQSGGGSSGSSSGGSSSGSGGGGGGGGGRTAQSR